MPSRQSKKNSQLLGGTVGPGTSTLKGKFSAGSIPLDTDFSDLIDIADCGRKAIGQSPDQSDNSVGVGLQLASDTGKLSVLSKADGGVVVDATGISLDQSYLQSYAFLPGMIMMYFDNGTGTAPTGWAICDGKNNTPDLTSKFVIGAQVSGETNGLTLQGDASARYVAATTEGAVADISNNATDGHTLAVSEIPKHTHEVNFHDSNNGYPRAADHSFNQGGDGNAPLTVQGGSSDQLLYASEQSSGGGTHSHGITQNKHTHTVNVEVPYYALMYIMKL